MIQNPRQFPTPPTWLSPSVCHSTASGCVYLASLTSERSRRVMHQALRTIAALLTGQDAKLPTSSCQLERTALPTHGGDPLRLVETFSPAPANRLLSACAACSKKPGAWVHEC